MMVCLMTEHSWAVLKHTDRKFDSKREIWKGAQWGTQISKYKLSSAQAKARNLFCYNHSPKRGNKPLHLILLSEKCRQILSSWACCITHLRCLATEDTVEPCLNYFADRNAAHSCCEPQPPWQWSSSVGKRAERSNLSPWWLSWRKLGGASGQRLGPREHLPLPTTGWSFRDHCWRGLKGEEALKITRK